MRLLAQLPQFFTLNAASGYRVLPIHHLVFWSVYLLFNFLRWGSYHGDYMLSLKGNAVGFPIHIALSYFVILYLVPKFLKTRRFIGFICSLFAAILVMVIIKYQLTKFLVSTNVWPEGPGETFKLNFNYVLTMMLGEFYVIAFVTAIKMILDWMREHSRATNLEKTTLEAELQLLKTQIAPHFLFNTLNNIYALTLEKSAKASETILKLSDLMRYMLYDSQESKQDLRKELLCIENYLDLERIRSGANLDVDLEISGDMEGEKISSMLLIPFVENAFKHGANKSNDPVKIKISIKVLDGFLLFSISNTIPSKLTDSTIVRPGGIGISNVRKRLELGYQEQEYDLKNYQENNTYKVELKLKLK